MRILFASQLAALPQRAGGNQSSSHELLTALAARGHTVAHLCGLLPGGWLGWRNRLVRKLRPGIAFPVDRAMGYHSYRGWNPLDGVGEVVRRFRPDVAVVQAGQPMPLARRLLDEAVTAAVYLRDVEFHALGGSPVRHPRVIYFANSRFTAARYRESFGIEAMVVPPLIDPLRYRSAPARTKVTFVNPHPNKGVEIAFRLAEARPDIPFEFVQSWRLRPDFADACRRRAAAAGNIDWRPPTFRPAEIYRNTRILLAPSVYQEAWGRVASEAQVNGIPVLASTSGGLPEAVGPGGLLVPPDAPFEDWLNALSRLWDDRAAYDRYAAAAAAHAARPEFQPDRLVDRFAAALADHAARSAVAA